MYESTANTTFIIEIVNNPPYIVNPISTMNLLVDSEFAIDLS